jgi:GNAT superfamily N-acetyltransferase
MIIREPNPEDKPAIIELLQLSLGETKLKKTQEIWEFKHEKNPFGSSPVFLAEEDAILVGVRVFMQWRWQLENEVWISYRAVDTATHPKHQGKGIFKKLTLFALDYVQKKSDCFVFNTPNNQSRPGYLKMGWQEVAKIKVSLIPTFFYFTNLFRKENDANSITMSQLNQLCESHNNNLINKKLLFTPKSAQYLKWRYENNPLQEYFVVSSEKHYIAMYVKRHKVFNELRVVETVGDFDKKNHAAIRKVISQFAIKSRCLFITTADKNLFSCRLYGGYGPKLTFRPMSNSDEFIKKTLDINNWSYSTGDLELF